MKAFTRLEDLLAFAEVADGNFGFMADFRRTRVWAYTTGDRDCGRDKVETVRRERKGNECLI